MQEKWCSFLCLSKELDLCCPLWESTVRSAIIYLKKKLKHIININEGPINKERGGAPPFPISKSLNFIALLWVICPFRSLMHMDLTPCLGH